MADRDIYAKGTVKITNGDFTAWISEVGAQLTNLCDSDREYVWNGGADIWPKHAPVLFPFVGRLKDGMYHYKGKAYGPMPIHGFVPTADFEVEENHGTGCTMKLVVTDEIRSIYPFDFCFRVRYELKGSTLDISYLVDNLGPETMIYGLGSHPGFSVPYAEGTDFEDYYLEFPGCSNVYRRVFSKNIMDEKNDVPYPLYGKCLPLKHNLFDDDAVCLGNTGNVVTIYNTKNNGFVRVQYPDTPWCAIWHKPKMEVPFVCIEPWFTLPALDADDDLEHQDFVHLDAKCSREHKLIITIGR